MNPKSKITIGLLLAISGGFCGFLMNAGRAHACTCASIEWRLHLQSVTSVDPGVDQRPFWPESTLFDLSTGAGKTSFSLRTDSEPTVVNYVVNAK
jgi:hypothetical protein